MGELRYVLRNRSGGLKSKIPESKSMLNSDPLNCCDFESFTWRSD